MSDQPDSKKIKALRTFAQDAARMRTMPPAPKKEASAPVVSSTPVAFAPSATPAPVHDTPVVAQPKKAPLPQKKAAEAKAVKKPEVTLKNLIPRMSPRVPRKKVTPAQTPRVVAVNPSVTTPLEIREEVNKISPQVKPSILAEETGIDVSAGNATGTIIRDTKRKRFKLIPAMLQATTDWYTHKKDAYEQSRLPQHTVESADARKEVIETAIEAAVSQKTLAPKEDFKTVAQKLKEAKRAPITSTITLKDKAEIPKPQWSYTLEEEVKTTEPLPPAAETTQPLPEEPATPATTAATKPVEVETPEPLPQTQEEEVVVQEMPAPTAPEESVSYQAPEPEAPYISSQEEPRVPYVPETPSVPQTPTAPPTAKRFPLYAFAVVVLVAIAGGVAVSYSLFTPDDAPQEKAVVYTIPSLIQTTGQHPFVLYSDRVTFLSALLENIVNTVGIAQFYPTIQQDGVEKPASAEEILLVMSPRTGGAFLRSITEIAFGGADTEPYIVMKVTSFDTAFAGMLDWERTMSADLSPLFGETVVESFDPAARTDTQVRAAFFKDVIASNKNARLLLDHEGRERIIYTFIDQNTILITTTKDALQALVPLVK